MKIFLSAVFKEATGNVRRIYTVSLSLFVLAAEGFGKDTKVYKFEKIKRAKAEAKRRHPNVELLDFGVGEPDDMAFPLVVEALKHECAKSENRSYADNGIDEFKSAGATYMEFGLRCRRNRPGHRGYPLHRLQARARHAAERLY